jgi:hypothetical protein
MSTPAGWYPQDDGQQRYWDGAQWTEHFAPRAAADSAAGSTLAGAPAVGDTAAYSYTTPVAADGALGGNSYPATNAVQAERPWFKKKRFLIPGGAVALVLVASMASAAGGGGSTPEPTTAAAGLLSASSTPTPSASAEDVAATPAPTPKPKPVAPKPKVVSFSGDGIYDVGAEVKPGLYRSSGSGYWERLKNASGDFEAIIANGNATGQSYVQIKKSDGYFSTSDMDDWVLVTNGVTGPQATKFSGDGVYMVGVDIKPGTYKASGSGYWERLRSAGGGFDGIIANGNPSGKAIVQIKKTDKFFNTTGMSEWTRVK